MPIFRRWVDSRVPVADDYRRPLCDAARLLANADFRQLYADPNSPVAQRIARLEVEIRSLDITDLPKMMALKGEFEGFDFVRRSLAKMAEDQAGQVGTVVAAKPNPGLLPVKPS